MWKPEKPSQNENEYFARRDAEWLRERRAALDAERAARGRSQPRIKCPRDNTELEERAFGDVKLDVCPKCHGVWFDSGELEMILHASRAELLSAVTNVGETSKE